MQFLTVRELSKSPKDTLTKLSKDGKAVLTNNGKPQALIFISEYWRVLHRPKFRFHPSQVSRLIDDIVRTDIAVEANIPNTTPMPDEEDRKFYDVAKSSGAFLITGNIKHFPISFVERFETF